MEAYQCVKANKGAADVDQQSLESFGKDLKDNLYKIWKARDNFVNTRFIP
jgi:RNA-directed DNA polymerase